MKGGWLSDFFFATATGFQSKSETLGSCVLSHSPFLFEQYSKREDASRCMPRVDHAIRHSGGNIKLRELLVGDLFWCPMPGSDQKRSEKGLLWRTPQPGLRRSFGSRYMPTEGCLVSSFITFLSPSVSLNGWRWKWQHGSACGPMVPVNLAPLNNIIGSSRRGLNPAVPAPCTCSGCSQGSAVTPRPPHTVEFKSTGPPRAHCAVPLPRPRFHSITAALLADPKPPSPCAPRHDSHQGIAMADSSTTAPAAATSPARAATPASPKSAKSPSTASPAAGSPAAAANIGVLEADVGDPRVTHHNQATNVPDADSSNDPRMATTMATPRMAWYGPRLCSTPR